MFKRTGRYKRDNQNVNTLNSTWKVSKKTGNWVKITNGILDQVITELSKPNYLL